MAGLSIRNLTRCQMASRAVFSDIATSVLPKWDISLVFVGRARARALNERLRGKSYVPNVLSYALGENSGEVIICPNEATKQAPDFQLPASSFQLLLFIHGLLHLKGWSHGVSMKRCERKLLSTVVKDATRSPHEAAHRDRNRHRHVPGEDGRRRGDSR